jgi:hypothetical protein
MEHRAMHCLACGDRLPLVRRIKGYWYCSEAEYRLEMARRHGHELDYRRELNPMRCSTCRGPIPLWRRVMAKPCCSTPCTANMHLIRGNPTRWVAMADVPETSLGTRLTRGGFVGLLIAGGIAVGRKFDILTAARESAGTTPSHEVAVADWTGYAGAGEGSREWAGPTGESAPWRIEGGWMQPFGAVLYKGIERAAGGALTYRFSLSDAGVARFLLGADRELQRHHVLEVASGPADLVLRAFRVEGAAREAIPGDVTIPRLNRSLHELAVEFTGDSIRARLNDRMAAWSRLAVRPGMVGVQGREEDGFRVYQARLSLEG